MSRHHVIPATSTFHTHTIIFLHGRDSLASEFASEIFESQASDNRTLPEILPHVKWVFPDAGLRPSERFDGDMSQWFDMWSLKNLDERQDIQQKGLYQSIDLILDILDREIALLGNAENVILAGISQGCATAIHALIRGNQKIGAFIGLSSWLPLQAEIRQYVEGSKVQNPALGTPVLLAHCKDDDVISFKSGKKLERELSRLGMDVEWHAYKNGGHWLNEPQGVDDLVAFLAGERGVCPEAT